MLEMSKSRKQAFEQILVVFQNQLISCVGFDSGCVRRQMDNFVHDLISPNHDGESKNLTI